MRNSQTSTVQLSFECTSGANLSVNSYAEGMGYDPSTVDFFTTKDVTQVYYNQSNSAYRISTNVSREYDGISGLNKRLKNINP